MSSGTDEDVSPGAVWVVAHRVIRTHEARGNGTWGRCLHCPEIGPCGSLAWAWRERLNRESAAAARLKALRLDGWPTTPPA